MYFTNSPYIMCYPVYTYAPVPYHGNVINPSYRQYPPVDVTLFSKSAESFHTLMNDANIIVRKLSTSKAFAKQVMEAAQAGNKERVRELIASTGVKEKVDVEYNPDQLRLSLTHKVEQTDCCKLTLAFRWR
ncbi:hypothetical protein P5G51_012515 [Virgibacillus sp. 179-BFC.A HS]|uniref:Uncharacterized protein n=1 Tax=Tigheibacillus jepli TaxID=3035914 RepID=A0ABU5CJJ7_9BACI|nr:hypothetical protein [Virgibacillus sp. 179-BFC.A HS]MDY0406106.1 hypothetical protein [Virgibacillus sp. 179-BFC.A HS]